MTGEYYTIHALLISGFRAYLEPKAFDFSKKRSVAVFAPNKSGKSSFIDALEFMFSNDGTLQRLGIRTIHNQAGVAALAHYLADERGIESKVGIKFKRGKDLFEGSRSTTGGRPRPPIASDVSELFVVDPIIRGHSLRRFVEERTAEERYVDVANWLNLGPLVNMQQHLRSLRQQVKAASEDESSLEHLDQAFSRETSGTIKNWDEPALLKFVNSELSRLDDGLKVAALTNEDPNVLIVTERAKIEEKQVGLAGLRQVEESVTSLYREGQEHEGGVEGLIPDFESAIATLVEAREREAIERAKAADSIFADVWSAAEPIFAEGAEPVETCPICNTPISDTRAGSLEKVREHIRVHLENLRNYAEAKKRLRETGGAVDKSKRNLVACLKATLPLLADVDAQSEAKVAVYLKSVENWEDGEYPSSNSVTMLLRDLGHSLASRIAQIESEQGEHTYSKARSKIERIIELIKERQLAERNLDELKALSGSLTDQATLIARSIREKLEALLGSLRTPTNEIYKKIQGEDAVPVRIELPPEDDLNQQRLNLLVDFAPSREGVQPAGYLSDSEIHSLALALRLAAIKRFNSDVPLVALDDIVTSYDADHRRSISGMIASELENIQVLLVTHDERFFLYLKDQLPEKNWQFLRITRLDRDFGPRFAEHKVSEDMIETRWNDGQSAANQMRQAEEEWLLGRCRDFGASVRIRNVDNAHAYDRAELASALASFLHGAGLTPPLVPGVNNRFLASLQKGVVENFGSHFRDAPYGDGSIGDERVRWEEFKFFRDQFRCSKCGRKRFKRPLGMNKPVCANEGCETPFDF